MKEIEQEFLDSGGVWENYRIGDVFVKLSSKFLGDGDKFKAVSKVKTEQYCVPVVYAKSGDNGIMYWAKEGDFETHRNVLSVVYNGAIAAGLVYAQPYDTGILAESYLIKVKEKDVSFNTNLFLKQVLEKVLYPKYSREYLATWTNKVENDQIQLPTQNGKIDFAFMENFIAELKALRVAELKALRVAELHAYLQVTGLSNYTLTDDEQAALNAIKTAKWQNFNVVDVFDVKNTFNILSRDIVENSGNVPYLSASRENNAVSSYISHDENFLDKGNCIFIGGKTFVVTYQEQDFYSNDSHNLCLYLKEIEKLNKLNQFFMISCLEKGLSHQYSWGNSISNKKIQKDQFLLPIKDGKIDYEFMEIFISAVQKLVIKDVVQWVDKQIEATEQVILN